MLHNGQWNLPHILLLNSNWLFQLEVTIHVMWILVCLYGDIVHGAQSHALGACDTYHGHDFVFHHGKIILSSISCFSGMWCIYHGHGFVLHHGKLIFFNNYSTMCWQYGTDHHRFSRTMRKTGTEVTENKKCAYNKRRDINVEILNGKNHGSPQTPNRITM